MSLGWTWHACKYSWTIRKTRQRVFSHLKITKFHTKSSKWNALSLFKSLNHSICRITQSPSTVHSIYRDVENLQFLCDLLTKRTTILNLRTKMCKNQLYWVGNLKTTSKTKILQFRDQNKVLNKCLILFSEVKK